VDIRLQRSIAGQSEKHPLVECYLKTLVHQLIEHARVLVCKLQLQRQHLLSKLAQWIVHHFYAEQAIIFKHRCSQMLINGILGELIFLKYNLLEPLNNHLFGYQTYRHGLALHQLWHYVLALNLELKRSEQ
jgi:hypothetical protein